MRLGTEQRRGFLTAVAGVAGHLAACPVVVNRSLVRVRRVHGTMTVMSLRLRPLGRAWSVCLAAVVLAILAATVSAPLLVTAASAHASLETVAPANDSIVASPPKEVVLRFDEPVALDLGGGIRVFDPSGRRVDRSVSMLRDRKRSVAVAMDDGGLGTYTVAWRVVSEDSHVLRGSSVFHIKTKTGPVETESRTSQANNILGWFARYLILAAATALLGSAVFVQVAVARQDRHQLRSVVIAAALALGLGSLLRFAVQVASTSGRGLLDAASLWGEAATSTRPGSLDAWRIGGAFMAVIGASMWMRRFGPQAVVLGAAVSVAVTALGGHAWTAANRSGAVVADVVHQLAAAGWVGGLLALAVLLRASRKRVGETESQSLLAHYVDRFGRIAMLCVALLFVTGVRGAYSLVGSIDLLTSTTYGRLVLLKLTGFFLMGALGWVNRRRLAALLVDGSRTVFAEGTVALLVLGVTASLVGAVPARAGSQEPFYTRAETATFIVDVTVLPATIGSNTLHLYFFDETGNPQSVDVATASIGFGDIPARRVSLVPISGDHYSAIGFSLPMKGLWTLTLQAVREGQTETVTLEVPVK